jgi:hypothetical protein
VELTGIESVEKEVKTSTCDTPSRETTPTPSPSRSVTSSSSSFAFGDAKPPTSEAQRDAVEAALVAALVGATQAERWDVVAQLAKELEARRLACSGSVVLIAKARS